MTYLDSRQYRWKIKNKLKVAESAVRWKENNPESYRFNKYRQSAKKRGYSFSLTLEQFSGLIHGRCYYCGDSEVDSRGIGVDRVDNKVGYNFDNCVSCCRPCNVFKKTMRFDEFIERCRKIGQRHNVTN
jgi:hypothetical protein